MLKRALVMVAWVVTSLAILDAAVNFLFPYPADPKDASPGELVLYFEYGRSAEGKLARMTRSDPTETAPITLAGWYNPIVAEEQPGRAGTETVTFYGMSHAVRLAHALGRTSSHFVPRIVAAPGATANWSYGAYLRDRGGGKSRAVVLSIMSANLPMISTMSPMTWNVSFPMPYTADRFAAVGDKLAVIHPPYTSFEDYARIFHDPAKWRAARDFFAHHDSMYDPFLMRKTFLDRSAIVRFIRRAYGQRVERHSRASVFGRNGFNKDSEQIRVANAIVKDFAFRARKDGILPVVYIVNNFGYSDNLYRALESTLKQYRIPYLSSHMLVSPNDPRGYLPDSHFTDENDDRLARALAKVIDDAR